MLYDITAVCAKHGITSRTLRYYEEIGLITSTLCPPSARRRYTEEQIDEIKRVLALRTLDLPIKTIMELKNNQSSLKKIILLHRADMIKSIAEKQAQINLLEEVLHGMDADQEVPLSNTPQVKCTEEQEEIAKRITTAILTGDFDTCHTYFSEDMKSLMPPGALAHAFRITVSPLGGLLSVDAPMRDERFPNTIIYPLRYERMTVRMKYVFHGNLLCGFWMDYQEKGERS